MINKNILFLAAANMVALFATAKTNFPDAVPADTSRVIDIEEVVVVASPKENFKLREQPSSVTLFSRENMECLGIKSIKNLTSYARNLFIPDYGSRTNQHTRRGFVLRQHAGDRQKLLRLFYARH